jgi:hypothetical protein
MRARALSHDSLLPYAAKKEYIEGRLDCELEEFWSPICCALPAIEWSAYLNEALV